MDSHPIQRLVNAGNQFRVNGVARNVFGVTMPRENAFLGKFSARFYKYLRLQNYQPEELLVAVTHSEIRASVLRDLGRNVDMKGQNIVLIQDGLNTLVNKTPKVVFMVFGTNELSAYEKDKVEEALKQFCLGSSGLYLIGDLRRMMVNPMGTSAYFVLVNRNLRADALPLKCPIHGSDSWARKPSHFTDRARCLVRCEALLACGHPCPKLCHLDLSEHNKSGRCVRPCDKKCPQGHQCVGSCGGQCPLCFVRLSKDFDCGHSIHYFCYQGTPKTCNDLAGAVLKACGHPRRGRCNGRAAGACQETVEKLMPCKRHFYKGPCGKQDQVCQVLTRPVCGHFAVKRCNDSGKEDPLDQPCKENCERRCRVGHPCSVDHPCGEPCPPCEAVITVLGSRGCDHSLQFICKTYEQPTRKTCPFECKRRRWCSHPCTLVCGEHVDGLCPPCDEIVTTVRTCGHEWTHECQITDDMETCKIPVDAGEKAMCSHPVQVPCGLKDQYAEGEASYDCKSVCGVYFDPAEGGCGHSCGQLCHQCVESGIHGRCEQLSTKLLLCGHKCDSICETLCPPCKQQCENLCEHGRCPNLCALPCDTCQEPCVYGCLHGKCTAQCGEICTKEPCNEPCLEKLACGHRCLGFCGEPCPPLCIICNKEELLKIDMLGKQEFSRDDRFVLLVDCGHTIDAEALEQLMTVAKVPGQISLKSCPLCRTVIRRCRRFWSQIRTIQQDMNRVKAMILGTPAELQGHFDEACQLVEDEYYGKVESPFPALLGRIFRALEELDPDSEIYDPSTVWLGNTQNFVTIARIYRKAVEINELAKNIPNHLQARLRWALSSVLDAIMCRNWPISEFQMTGILREWDRILAMETLYSRWRNEQPITAKRLLIHPKGYEAFKTARQILDEPGPYSDSSKQRFADAVKVLEAALESQLRISDPERVEILKAFNYSMGRWFKCPNGHIYVVTECGGVTQEGRCNECGAVVGGYDHMVLPNNDLATEMDGATEPLYPTALSRRQHRIQV